MTELGRATTLEGIVEILIARRKQLGLAQHVVDDLAGYADGYTGKIEAGMKGLGKLSLPGLLGALGTELVVMPAASRHRNTSYAATACLTGADFFKRRAMKARKVQVAKQTPQKRRALARAAAKARWRKVKAERERRHSAASTDA